MKLTANKRKLYRLVSEYIDLPDIAQTKLDKARGRRAWWLYWRDAGEHSAYFSTCAGKAVLLITGRRAITIPLEKLREYGLVEE